MSEKIYCNDCQHQHKVLPGFLLTRSSTCHHSSAKYIIDTSCAPIERFRLCSEKNANNDCSDYLFIAKAAKSFVRRICEFIDPTN